MNFLKKIISSILGTFASGGIGVLLLVIGLFFVFRGFIDMGDVGSAISLVIICVVVGFFINLGIKIGTKK